jgi:hypothetical protein
LRSSSDRAQGLSDVGGCERIEEQRTLFSEGLTLTETIVGRSATGSRVTARINTFAWNGRATPSLAPRIERNP